MRTDDLDGQGERQRAAGAARPALDVALSFGVAEVPVEEPRFLFFRCAGVDCAAPLAALREVLPQCPAALPLPHSPEWLLGVFALRAELVGLADPAPLLFAAAPDRAPGSPAAAPCDAAIVVGSGDRSLAWTVESIGATTASGVPPASGDEADVSLVAGNAAEEPHALFPNVAARYAAGAIAHPDGRRCAVIDAEALLADMLRTLEERPENP